MRPISPLARIFVFATVVLVSAPQPSRAQSTALRLPALFGDNMIVQRDQPVRVWGWAEPGAQVRVAMGSASTEAVASEDGSWRVELPPFSAGGPYTLIAAGIDTLRLENVLVGDVWLAGGQSNMEWPLVASTGAEEAIAAANNPQIRHFTIERGFSGQPADDVASSGWHETNSSSVREVSAVAYYFGRELHRELGVPIGILESNWGGSTAEAWMSPVSLSELPYFKPIADSILAGLVSPQVLYDREAAAYEDQIRAWSQAVRELDPGFTIEGAVWAHPSFVPADWDTMAVPGAWEEGSLPDFDGIVWFKKTFEVPAEWAAWPLHISLGIVDDADSTWLNGVLVGGAPSYGERTYVVPPEHVRPGANVLTMRIIDDSGPGGIRGDEEALRAWPEGLDSAAVSLAGDWAYRPALRLSELPRRSRPPAPHKLPAGLFNGMIAPLAQFPLKGVIWYQGESNADRAFQYRTLFPKLIADWRALFSEPELPFLYVQLANYMDAQDDPNEQSAWAELREAQTMTLQVPRTAMALSIDVGEANDIHPRDKQTVGHRLALAALATAYGRDTVYSGPQYVAMRIDGDAVRLLFTHVGSGLEARGGPLTGFALAGPDGNFRWADARIDGDAVVVRHPDIDDPRAVRYGWANNPPVNLYNREGLPAIPFRTDNLPGITER